MKFLLLLMLLPVLAFADHHEGHDHENHENKESTAKKKKVDEADQAITNRRFRAANGSLSPLSVAMRWSYNGGSLESPFSADRPNISNAGDTALLAGIVGSVNATYRLSSLQRLNLGFGVQMLTPFHDSIDDDVSARTKSEFEENGRELDISNPGLSYTYMNKFYGIQTIISAGFTFITAGNLTNGGYEFSLSTSVNTMYDIGKTGLSVGMLFVLDRYFFDGGVGSFNDKTLKNQNEMIFGFLPQIEYVINDTFNLRTIVRSHWYQNNRLGSRSDYTKRPVTQSVGLGISLGRDVFLYPNVQFSYDHFALSNTNVALTANINVF